MSIRPNATEQLPLETAAQQLATTPLSVLMHIKRGLLVAEEHDGRWYVDSASLEALRLSLGGAVKSLCRSQCAASGGCKSCG